ncbi:TrkH family potassium uptake protein [Roseburia sp. MSJ-14]|uniref:TrkH family potassium uptake protein n=1 Tax=Roseburia sp. MSJ-14 TaxID=2841514 RepID=UPI001C112DDF|nr:TrkH family potassium uptake protein [Roseburia sp. MSJ-14]MBU5473121.1 TrkH family potassium uptake protein [Roseburia sp. MSJ-14]
MIRRLSKVQTIALGFFLIIVAGTLLLMLPIASRDGHSTGFLHALFTATSSTCVTGLVVVDTYTNWTLFGQVVILALIQIGGLGFITIGMFFSIFLKRKIGLKERNLIQESVNTLQISGIVRLVKKIVCYTIAFEGIGAILLMTRFIPRFGWLKGIWYGIFHAISAFCNAGFDLMGQFEPYASLTMYYDDIVINIVVMALIIIGGIGFIVWDDISKHKWHIKKYMLHTKIVLMMTAVLTLGGALCFYLFERNNLLLGMNAKGQILSSLFGSVTTRTAGFNTLDTGAYTEATRMLTVILMFIGGNPGSTAGGIKTTTMLVILLYIWANLRNKRGLNIFGRRLDEDAIKKASTVFCINLILATVCVTIMSALETLPLSDIMMEVFSAIGTVGISTGITRDISMVSKYMLIILMYCGRIGSMSFALAFTEKKKSNPVQLPVEQITIG